jgi:hypothetical protein
MDEDKYRQGTRDVVYLLDDARIKRETVGLKEAVDFIANDNKATKLQQADYAAYIPKKKISFQIDKQKVIENKVVAPEDYDKIVDEITIDLSGKSYLAKDEMMILDMLATNDWERPIYWAITVGRNKYMNLNDYFQVEGFAYRFVPIKSESSPDRLIFGRVETDLMYDNLMNKFEWGNMNDPNIYIDENNERMMTNIRNSFLRLAEALIEEGKKDSAIVAIDRCNEIVPHEIIPYEYFAVELANAYIAAGAVDKGKEMIETAFSNYDEELGYFFNLDRKLLSTRSVREEIQRNLFYMQRMASTTTESGLTELANKINTTMQEHFKRYSEN